MDEQTMKDYIEDLLQERADLYAARNLLAEQQLSLESRLRELQAEVKRLETELARHA